MVENTEWLLMGNEERKYLVYFNEDIYYCWC